MDIKVNKEIRQYKEKIYFNLTLRQLVCTVLGLAIAVPTYFWGKDYIGEDAAAWIIIIFVMPIFAIGYLNINNMTFEKLLIQILKFELVNPKKRIYKTESIYKVLNNTDEKPVKIKKPKNKKSKKSMIKSKSIIEEV